MLTITVGATESYDEQTEAFVFEGGTELQLEHSLVSLSKWESIHEKSFLGEAQKTSEEMASYVECMIVGEKPPENFLSKLSAKNVEEINAYINAKMTATTFFGAEGSSKKSETITAELIYYWMTVFQIDFECQYWHLNRLFTLIRICNIKQQKPKKMSRTEVAARNRELNARRKAEMGTKG